MNRLRGHEFEAGELMAYLDGELEAQRAAELVAHMNHCAECEALAKDFRQISERMLDFQVEATPEKIIDAVRAAVAESNVEPKQVKGEPGGVRALRRIFTKPYGLALGGALVVAIVSFGVWMSNGSRSTLMEKPSPNDVAEFDRTRENMAPPASAVAAEQSALRGRMASKSVESLPPQARSVFMAPKSPAPPPPSPNQRSATDMTILQQPMIARTASLTITAANYDEASAALQSLAASHGGYVQQMSAQSEQNLSRSVSATLRVPASQLDTTLTDLRRLGHVEDEKQDNAEVTDEYVDVDARLKNARATEQRLIDLLATRTGKLDDVLDVEREVERVRGDIESMDAQRTLLLHRVEYATVTVELNEQYKEHLNSDSAGAVARIWNALVAGIRNLMEGALGGAEFLLTYGPSILFWSLLILVPAWLLSRKYGWLERR